MKVPFSILLAILATASFSYAKPKTLVFGPERNTVKIVGGIEALPNEFPFVVDIRLLGQHWCGGSIVSEDWVLTAAQCAQNNPWAYTVIAGDHNVETIEGSEQRREVIGIYVNPGYGSGSVSRENDIALFHISPPFEFNVNVSAVTLPPVGFVPTDFATTAGWGSVSEEDTTNSAKLMKVELPRVPDIVCNSTYDGEVAESMICYGEAGKDACGGDAGGPLLCAPNNTLCGIVSWGTGCGRPNLPGVYTETSNFDAWIRSRLPADEDETPVDHVPGCGGLVETTSGFFNRSNDDLTPNQHCTWTIKVPHDRLRLRLTASGLGIGDGLYVTRYERGNLGQSTQINVIGEDYRFNGGGLYLLTLNTAPTTQGKGFDLEFYGSGNPDAVPPPSAYSDLNSSSGTFSYPSNGGEYGNLENAVFILNPETPGMSLTLTFTSLDIEEDTSCQYDAVSVHSWENNQFNLLARFCGETVPQPFQIPNNLALVLFSSDESVVGRGFTFNW